MPCSFGPRRQGEKGQRLAAQRLHVCLGIVSAYINYFLLSDRLIKVLYCYFSPMDYPHNVSPTIINISLAMGYF
jgi:hypothetical protein